MTQTTLATTFFENILLVIAEAAASSNGQAEAAQKLEDFISSIREVFSNPMISGLVTDMTDLALEITHNPAGASDQDRELLNRMLQSTRFALGLDVDVEQTEFSEGFLDAVSRGAATNPEKQPALEARSVVIDNLAELDPDLCSAFIAQHRESLEIIEAAVMTMESGDSTPEDLAEIKRHLHTMKGDAGLVGLRDLETSAHKLEDTIEEDGPDITNGILQFVDWARASIEAVVRHFGGEGDTATPTPAAGAASEAAPEEEEGSTAGIVPEKLDCDPETTSEFVTEANELLDGVEEMLLVLESDRKHTDSIHAVFRAFHSIKGVSSFLELDHIRDLAHEVESLLDMVRANKLEFSDDAFEVTLQTFDRMRKFVLDVQRANNGDKKLTADPTLPSMLKRLIAVREGRGLEEPAVIPMSEPKSAEAAAPEKNSAPAKAAPANAAPEKQSQAQAQESRAAAKRVQSSMQETIRVEPARLDRLVDSIGELVIAESMVTKTLENQESSQLSHLRKITRELQELAMSLRMVPLRSTFRRMARLARDVAKKLGKRIDFSCLGEEAELDKTMVDAIGDPLMHMIRNAVDHGLEDTPDERRAAGKDEVGNVTLRAYHEGGSIFIEVSDDGGGMNRDAIIKKAIDRGILTEGESLTDTEAFGLVFEPGFSTAKQVSEVSGRGVGLDVVKRSIEALRGHVEIRSELGKGTTFSMRLPLTLAIIDGMVVRIGVERFVIPTLDIVRIVRRRDVDTTKVFDRAPVIRIGDELIPLIDLGQDLRSADDRGGDGAFVVVDSSEQSVAIGVDELIGQQQIVIKSLGTSLADARGFAGGTIMPDGRVSLILDIAGLMSKRAQPLAEPV